MKKVLVMSILILGIANVPIPGENINLAEDDYPDPLVEVPNY